MEKPGIAISINNQDQWTFIEDDFKDFCKTNAIVLPCKFDAKNNNKDNNDNFQKFYEYQDRNGIEFLEKCGLTLLSTK